MKQLFSLYFIFILHQIAIAQQDSVKTKSWIRNKISFGRSQHIQYLGNNKTYKANTLFNKSYYMAFAPIQTKGFKPFISLNYEYFITRAACFTCYTINNQIDIKKQLHFINFASLGIGLTKGMRFKYKTTKEIELIIGASLERYLFKKAFIFNDQGDVNRVTPFVSKNSFYNQFFFRDIFGFRVYNSSSYKVFIQLSGLLLRNERLNYAPSRYTFHNFMLGFNVYLK
jgi:hypothetical protein